MIHFSKKFRSLKNISISGCKTMSFSWGINRIFLTKMQAVTAYSKQRLKTTDGGGEERGGKKKRKKNQASPNKFPAAKPV